MISSDSIYTVHLFLFSGRRERRTERKIKIRRRIEETETRTKAKTGTETVTGTETETGTETRRGTKTKTRIRTKIRIRIKIRKKRKTRIKIETEKDALGASLATGGRKRAANPETEIERSRVPGLETRTGGRGLDQDQKTVNGDPAPAAAAKVAAGTGAAVGVAAGTAAAVGVVVESAGGEAAVETGGGAAVESVDVHAPGVKRQNCK